MAIFSGKAYAIEKMEKVRKKKGRMGVLYKKKEIREDPESPKINSTNGPVNDPPIE
ncbi:MAG: hypothetical protein ACI9QL_000027 [Candidatus Omnitrophota bacterium]|jgi:hypothetical protein